MLCIRTSLFLLMLTMGVAMTAKGDSLDDHLNEMCVKIEAAAIRRDRGATKEATVNWLVSNASLSRSSAERVANIAYKSKDSPADLYSQCMETLGE